MLSLDNLAIMGSRLFDRCNANVGTSSNAHMALVEAMATPLKHECYNHKVAYELAGSGSKAKYTQFQRVMVEDGEHPAPPAPPVTPPSTVAFQLQPRADCTDSSNATAYSLDFDFGLTFLSPDPSEPVSMAEAESTSPLTPPAFPYLSDPSAQVEIDLDLLPVKLDEPMPADVDLSLVDVPVSDQFLSFLNDMGDIFDAAPAASPGYNLVRAVLAYAPALLTDTCIYC